MAKLAQLHIENFRGIKDLELKGLNKGLVCFVGRGDCGKTTILEAISRVLSSQWNLNFNDTDFYNGNIDNPIKITVYLVDLPAELMTDTKYGLYIQKYNSSTECISPKLDDDEGAEPILAVQLTVDRTLEPKWAVISGRENQDPSTIGTSTRASLNCFYVSDYVDRHFSWNKGNPLYALYRNSLEDKEAFSNKIVANSLRAAKSKIDKDSFDDLNEIQEKIKVQAAALGLNISKVQTTMDIKDMAIKDGRVSLHENSVPFRLKGKGSKRLSSYAIQLSLLEEGGILLADEIEQGLEPDRIRNLVSTLKEENKGQIFLTTHSRDAIVELESNDLCYLKKDNEDTITYSYLAIPDLQKTVRACPEAFFAKKVVVCEGKTETGLCRALDAWRQKNEKLPLAFHDCAYILGNGSELIKYTKDVKEAGLTTALFCDSDETKTINSEKESLKTLGVTIIDCADNLKIEEQVFRDLPWDAIQEIFKYVVRVGITTEEGLKESVKAKYGDAFPSEAWTEMNTEDMRKAIAKASCKDKGQGDNKKEISWFKRIDHGEELGNIIFEFWDKIEDEKHLKKMFRNLSNWVDA